MRKLTTAEFIEKSKTIHGIKYDYELVNYFDAKTNVKIICNKHGAFEQSPDNHLRGAGCKKCTTARKCPTYEDFITTAISIHDNKYDYSVVEYVNLKTKIKIICKKHGEFKQTPRSHINGHGCKTCAGNNRGNTDKFISDAESVHKNKFDYSLSIYVSNQTKLSIICPEHGEFKQTPNAHLSGKGCNKCRTSKNSLDWFLKRCDDVHGSAYDYSLVKYINAHTKIDIVCKKHGVFSKKPCNHTNKKQGCPACSREDNRGGYSHMSNIELMAIKDTVLYTIMLEHEDETFVKIGITKDPNTRLSSFYPYSVVDKLIVHHDDMLESFTLEQELQNKFSDKKYIPRNKFRGYGECFDLSVWHEASLSPNTID